MAAVLALGLAIFLIRNYLNAPTRYVPIAD